VDDGREAQGPASRRAALRALPTPTDVEIFVADAPPLLDVIDELPEPRIADLDALLREVDCLRSTMRRDLTLAATAAEAGDPDLANWLLLGEGGEVRAFEERALAHLSALAATSAEADLLPAAIPAPSRRTRRMLPAAPFVAAAAAVVGFLTGAIPGVGGSAPTAPRTSNAALQSYAQLTQLASDGASATKISDAAQQFHAALAPLVASNGANPLATEKAIAMLQSERAVIVGQADSPALRAVLAQADALVRRLQATLPRRPGRVILPSAPVPSNANPPSDSAAPKSSAKPSPSPKASPKPSPSPTPSPSASPSAKASPQPSSSDQGPIPGTPTAPH